MVQRPLTSARLSMWEADQGADKLEVSLGQSGPRKPGLLTETLGKERKERGTGKRKRRKCQRAWRHGVAQERNTKWGNASPNSLKGSIKSIYNRCLKTERKGHYGGNERMFSFWRQVHVLRNLRNAKDKHTRITHGAAINKKLQSGQNSRAFQML